MTVPRLKSELWVQAFLRSQQVAGRFGAVIRRGAAEAGAVYVIVNHLDGTLHLFGPAPGPVHDDAGERRWIVEKSPPAGQAEADAVLGRRQRFDPDIWIVEIEDKTGTAGLSAEARSPD
jgi:hypothetical protein